MCWLPPVSVVAVAYITVIHFYFNPCWDDGCSCEAVWAILADWTALFWLIYRIYTLWYGTVCNHTVDFIAGLTPAPFTRRRLKFLQDFISLPMIFTKVFHFLTLRTTSIVFHFSAFGVNFGTLWLITNRPILCTNARTVRVTREKSLP